MFQGVFAQGNKGTDAQNVADQLAALIDTQGERPIRTTVGNNMGVDQINTRVAPVQAEFIRSFLPMAGIEAQDKRLFVSATISLKLEHYEEGRTAIEAIIPQTLSEPGCHVFSLMERKDSRVRFIFLKFSKMKTLCNSITNKITPQPFLLSTRNG